MTAERRKAVLACSRKPWVARVVGRERLDATLSTGAALALHLVVQAALLS